MTSYPNMSESEIAELSRDMELTLARFRVSLSELARRAGVNQPMAHRARMGNIQLRTPNIRRLQLYVSIALSKTDAEDVRRLDASVLAFLSAGGNVDELIGFIDAYTSTKRRAA